MPLPNSDCGNYKSENKPGFCPADQDSVPGGEDRAETKDSERITGRHSSVRRLY